ncbi:flagellar motor switch protein FliM [Cognatiyoonia koreensis]|uniref:Flagellar motor switch protein FliM n=1 Tax=Cognatiyoonia koreensis TaxID=364200 RepID=A0A1I0PZS7_9RHOB|nr:FliM/FliN family flagellar motor switch protein [Cognatiyoonia koreensis]SEW20098.1 flagellar motor switch protein FliM [Cognatiyoonia koreensis]
MTGKSNPAVLQRMIGRTAATATEVPVTASRAMRLAVTRAAERTVGLQLTVGGVVEETLELDGVQDTLRDELLLLKLANSLGETVGVLALDRAFVAAIVEVQTTGRIGASGPDERPITLADLVLAEPMLAGLFGQLADTTSNTALDGWTTGIVHTERYDDVRAIGLVLPHVTYRLMRLTLDLGGTDRRGELLLALPWDEVPVKPAKVAPLSADWSAELHDTVMRAPAALSAILHRFDLPLHVANNLQTGQVLPLHGCTVSSVTLVGPDGVKVAKARLGQSGGHIAVRLENPIAPAMTNLTPRRSTAALEGGQMGIAQVASPVAD